MAAVPYKVKAVFEYTSAHDDDLSFPNGQIITVTEEEGADWCVGEYTDAQGSHHTGLFPRNFVERYEPEIPSRPTRQTRPKSTILSPPLAATGGQDSDTPVSPIVASQAKQPPAPVFEPTPQVAPEPTAPQQEVEEQPEPAHEEPAAATAAPVAPSADTPSKPKPAGAKGPPPPVAGKSNAFKDRIAAFNKESNPVMPFKPAGSSANYAIKKPFVAPPPSRDSYVPPPRVDPVAKVYRRDEDPEIAERIAEDQAAAENAGLVASPDAASTQVEGEEDAPKPQSLKERIALLQKQQAEQAQKRADVTAKEKPKRPAKKRTDSSEPATIDEQTQPETEQSLPVRGSMDSVDQSRLAASRVPSPPASPFVREPEAMDEGNEADQSAADETTEANDDSSDTEEADNDRNPSVAPITQVPRAAAAPVQEPDVGEEEDTTEDQSEEEEMDAETRRRMELRERMAKLSGGMGMAGMFGPQPGMAIAPPARKNSKPKERVQSVESPVSPPPVPMFPVPGMFSPKSAETRAPEDEVAVEKEDDEEEAPISRSYKAEEVPDMEDVKPDVKDNRRSVDGRGVPPPVPGERPVPIPPPASSRPMPPVPPSRSATSHVVEEEALGRRPSVDTPRAVPPPVPAARASTETARSPISGPKVNSYFGSEAQPEASAPRTPPVRGVPPPIPGMAPLSPSLSRPPPPPPPTAAPQPAEDEAEESEYEGDYDTDIASGEKHKAALRTHARQPSADDDTTADEATALPPPPAVPPPAPQRGVPPPLPPSAPKTRTSTDIPRAAPPPIPAMRAPQAAENDDDGYDNSARFSGAARAVPPPPPPTAAPVPVPPPQQDLRDDSSDDLYRAPTKKSLDMPRTAPPPPAEPFPVATDNSYLGARQSLEASRTLTRKSMDAPRPSGEHYIASDVDLAEGSQWWAQPGAAPPALQGRSDVLFEVEESSTSKRGGKTTISKDVYVIYMDYSQSTITARFDKADPLDVALEQRHEPPPPRMRQDQLEHAWEAFGSKIAGQASALANSKKDPAPAGDGSPFALALELIRAHPSALQPIGIRSYGALVYANIGNASVQQFDEIRPGDMITFRNAKLQGKHGGLHQKYSQDVGAGSGHVAIVTEWDGTKKKVRALEQSRDDKGRTKVRVESYRLGDLKSGEVRVWRVVGREWVGWDAGK